MDIELNLIEFISQFVLCVFVCHQLRDAAVTHFTAEVWISSENLFDIQTQSPVLLGLTSRLVITVQIHTNWSLIKLNRMLFPFYLLIYLC